MSQRLKNFPLELKANPGRWEVIYSLKHPQVAGHPPLCHRRRQPNEWAASYNHRHSRPKRLTPRLIRDYVEIERIFHEALSRWIAETSGISSIRAKVTHESYLTIIGLGLQAVPLVLKELQSNPDYWFTALSAMTNAQPVPMGAKRFQDFAQAWLEWGAREGYLGG